MTMQERQRNFPDEFSLRNTRDGHRVQQQAQQTKPSEPKKKDALLMERFGWDSDEVFSQASRDGHIVQQQAQQIKSLEPKKKDALLMERWDSDDEDNVEDPKEVYDVLDAIEIERPSSGDSGCQVATTPTTNLPKAPEEKKKMSGQWRKSKVAPVVVRQENILQTFRQSVNRKHDASSTSTLLSSHSSTKDVQSTSSGSPSLTSSQCLNGQICIPLFVKSNDYDDVSEDSGRSSGDQSSRTNRAVGSPWNNKSMSRQRRDETNADNANNARERKRINNINEAFKNLRRVIPAYVHNQKLTKLAILRIAGAYIVALGRLIEQDYSEQQSRPSLADCVEQCTRTIQAGSWRSECRSIVPIELLNKTSENGTCDRSGHKRR